MYDYLSEANIQKRAIFYIEMRDHIREKNIVIAHVLGILHQQATNYLFHL